jgi:hypothetical protein
MQRNAVTSKSSIEQASQETPPEGFLGKDYLGKHRNGDPKGLLTASMLTCLLLETRFFIRPLYEAVTANWKMVISLLDISMCMLKITIVFAKSDVRYVHQNLKSLYRRQTGLLPELSPSEATNLQASQPSRNPSRMFLA